MSAQPMSIKQPAPVKHFLQFKDFTREEFEYLFERTRIIKQKFKAYQQYWPLTDRTLVMIFEKASTRTRLSFEAGVQQLGGSAVYPNTRDSPLGRGGGGGERGGAWPSPQPAGVPRGGGGERVEEAGRGIAGRSDRGMTPPFPRLAA